jgi:hypothetical protein
MELFNLMSFDLCDRPLKIRKSIGTLTCKGGAHLGVWRFIPSHSPTFPRAWNVTPGLHSWPTPLQALALVVSPRLGLQHLMIKFLGYVRKQFDHPILFLLFDGPWFDLHHWFSNFSFYLKKSQSLLKNNLVVIQFFLVTNQNLCGHWNIVMI